jgi:hypothetical protein
MATDYNEFALLAKTLIEDEFSGAAVTLVALDFDADDSTKPWRGPVDPRATPGKTLAVKALFLPIAGNIKLGLSKQTIDLIKRADATALVGSGEDLRVYQELVVDRTGERFKITYVEELMPADVRILSYLVLNQ